MITDFALKNPNVYAKRIYVNIISGVDYHNDEKTIDNWIETFELSKNIAIRIVACKQGVLVCNYMLDILFEAGVETKNQFQYISEVNEILKNKYKMLVEIQNNQKKYKND